MIKEFLQPFLKFISLLSCLLGSTVMMGWFIHSEAIIQIIPSLVPMQFNTALCFVLSGLILFLLNRRLYIPGLYLSIILGLLAFLTFLEYVFGSNLMIDELLIDHYITTDTTFPGRMAPNTALSFIITSLSYIIFVKRYHVLLVCLFGSIVYLLGLAALVGYIIDLDEGYLINIHSGYFTDFRMGYNWGQYTSMALHTSIGLILLGIGIVIMSWMEVLRLNSESRYWDTIWIFLFILPLFISLFIIDLSLPLSINVGIGYILIIILSNLVDGKKSTVYLTIYGTILIILGYFLSDSSYNDWDSMINRTLTIMSLWTIAISLINLKKKNSQFITSNKLLKSTNLVLDTKNNELEQMTFISTHDLREPLLSVMNYIGLLEENLKEYNSPDKDKFIQYINLLTQQMDSLIIDIVNYSSLGDNRKIELVDCNELIQVIQKDLNYKIKKSQASISYDRLPKLQGCEMELYSLFSNLISNAIKFSKTEDFPRISISVTENNGVWNFFIKDNGIGISEENTDRIFSIFQRLHLKDAHTGKGKGLAHCKKIVLLHGGTIGVKSKLNVGSTFYFSIPN